MLPLYNFICIPLDTRDPAITNRTFALEVVTELEFPMGVSHDPSAIRDVLIQHPVLSRPSNQPLSAFVWEFRRWNANGRSMDVNAATKVAVKYSGATPLEAFRRNLLNYMGAAKETVTTASLQHDSRHERLPVDHFVDITKAADDLRYVTNALKLSALRSLNATSQIRRQSLSNGRNFTADVNTTILLTNLETASVALAKWIDGSMHSSVLEVLAEKNEERREQLYSAFASHVPRLQNIRNTVESIVRRITVDDSRSCPLDQTDSLMSVLATGESQAVNVADPNIAVHSAIKNSLLAEKCGFVTSWSVESPTPIYGDIDYVIQLDISSLVYDKAKIEVQPSLPSAFRRLGHTHPVSFSDVGSSNTQNSALACLNDKAGQARYRATCVNAEAGLVKGVILETKNSLAGPSASAESSFGKFTAPLDNRAPQLLHNDQFGTPEPETSGVVFSAPTDDLRTPTGLTFGSPQERRAALPCLFLEDLWIGYRLDLRGEDHENFSSIHTQEQEITFTQSGETVSGITEDYIEREQPDDRASKHSSTDLITYNGLSSGQAKDYLILLGVDQLTKPIPQQPFKQRIKSYGKTERVTFGRTYEYRFRNVFRCGISCDCADLKLREGRFSKQYRQQFPFFRARALRPGETLRIAQQGQKLEDGRTIYLTSEQPYAAIALVPSPIDIDSSRFHGILFASKDETKKQRKRMHVSDLGKFFKELPPAELNYFYDPDVYGVIVRAKVVNGDERGDFEDLDYMDGTYCKIVRHITLEPVTEMYGREGDWQRFKPIVLSFHTSMKPGARVRKEGWLGHSRHIEVEVPPAAELHLSLVPLFNRNLMSKTASYLASSADLQEAGLEISAANSFPIPAVAEQLIKVIHAVKEPRQKPTLFCDNPRMGGGAASGHDTCVAGRKLDSEFGSLFGRVELDAASTKEVRLEAAWMDVNDDPNQGRYVLEPGTTTTTPRSVVFREFTPVHPSAANFHKFFLSASGGQPSEALLEYKVATSSHGFADQFMLQCVEDKVFLGQPPEDQPVDVTGTSNRLNFKDQRRKYAKIEAVVVSRFAERFKDKTANSELRSNSVMVDVPSTIRMTAPKVSHIVPLRREFRTGNSGSGTKAATFGVRIYLRKGCFQSSVGERLAIGCAAGGEAGATDAEILKYVTQWGEDPVERAALRSTTRMPRASDFVAPDSEVNASSFDENLYPPNAVGGRMAVIYRDNVALARSVPGSEQRWVSVASYALRYDDRQSLWYADIQIEGDFFGWCGMALYRHQPHALPERELSDTSAWVYAAVLYGEPVAWVEKQDTLYVTIGPVYDASVSFDLDSLEYREGVSPDLSEPGRILHPLKSYRVGKGLYFEAVVPKKHFDWSLFKKRFGYPVASARLRD